MYKFINNSVARGCGERPQRVHQRSGIAVYGTRSVSRLPQVNSTVHPEFVAPLLDYYVTRQGNVHMFTRPGFFVEHGGAALYKALHITKESGNQMYIAVGLEVAGPDVGKPSTEQYVALASLIRALVEYHQIPLYNIMPIGKMSRIVNLPEECPGLLWGKLSAEVVAPSFEGGYLVFTAVLA